MNKKLLRLPILTIIGGVILRIITYIALKIIVEPSGEWGSKFFYINLVSSLVIIFIVGIILRRTYDKDTFFKSATLLVIYSFIIWGLSEIGQYFGIYSITASLILYLPTEIFNIITSVLREMTSTQSMALIYGFVFIEKFAPYLFLFFAKKGDNIK